MGKLSAMLSGESSLVEAVDYGIRGHAASDNAVATFDLLNVVVRHLLLNFIATQEACGMAVANARPRSAGLAADPQERTPAARSCAGVRMARA